MHLFHDNGLAVVDVINFSRHKKQGLEYRPKREFVVDGKVVGNWGSEVRFGFFFLLLLLLLPILYPGQFALLCLLICNLSFRRKFL